MNIFLVILFTLVVLACGYLVLRYLILAMPKSSARTLLGILATGGTLLLAVLLILSTFIPKTVNTFIDGGIEKVETNINNVSPNYIYEERDTASIKAFLADYKQIEAGIESNENARFFTRLIGVHTYIDYLNAFTESFDNNMQEMEEEGIPFTVHNIFMRVKDKSQETLLHITKIVEIVILAVTLLFFIALIIIYFMVKHEMMEDAKVVIAETPADTAPNP